MCITLARASLVKAQLIDWILPEPQWIKINIDRVWKSLGMAGTGVVAWDNLDSIMFNSYDFIGALYIAEAEFETLNLSIFFFVRSLTYTTCGLNLIIHT